MTSYFKTVDWKSANSIALFWVSCDLFKKDFNITSPADSAVALSLSLSLFCSVDAVAFWDKEMRGGGRKIFKSKNDDSIVGIYCFGWLGYLTA